VDTSDLFPGFTSRRIRTAPNVEIFVRTGGHGPPLLLLHGYPQTHVIWHRIARDLAQLCALVIADIRGYGASSAPRGDEGHITYSKRAMAEDCIAVMRELGHARFAIAGHDRGGRIAYRLALDHPDVVSALVPIDIIPTGEVWRRANSTWAVKTFHWSFLAQPTPLPERLIGNDPVFWVEQTLAAASGTRDLSVFYPKALESYRASLMDPARVHAVCEDYRAGASVDRKLDDADLTAGRRIECPTLLLWADDYLASSPLDVWVPWCKDLSGAAVRSGHYLAEENPEETLAALIPFLRRTLNPEQLSLSSG
jgi:haloacetate dehalogenase